MRPPKAAGQLKSPLSLSSSRPAIVRVELTPAAKRQTIAIPGRHGMTQIAALSRSVEWLAGQSEAVQAAVFFGQDDEHAGDG